jgi:glutamine synthetase
VAATGEGQKTVEQVLEEWRNAGIRYVRFELPDMHGTSRSKTVPIDHAGAYAETGLNMYGGAVVLDSRSDIVSGTLYNEEVAYADQRLRPDAATARIVPWVETTGRMICDT